MNAKTLKRHSTTLILSALALGGILYLRFVDRGSVTTAESEARKRNLLPAFRMDGISEIRLNSKGKTAKLYQGKEDGDGDRPWMLELEGHHYPTDRQTVDQFLGSLDYGVAERKVDENSISPSEMKLDRPRVHISLLMDGKTMNLSIGGEAASPEGAAYAQAEGRGPVVITGQLLSALNIDPQSFRARAFSPYLFAELASIELAGQGGGRKLIRAEFSGSRSPAFRLDGPEVLSKVRVKSSYTEQLLFSLSNLQAERFLSAEQVQTLPKAPVQISLRPRDEQKALVSIELGAPCPLGDDSEEWIAAVRKGEPPMAACVPKSVLAPMTKTASEMADDKLFAATADAVSELKMSMGKEVLELARKESEWHERTPHDRDIDADIGKSLLESLLSLTGTLEAGDPAGFGEPRGVLRLISAAEAQTLDAGPGERIEEIEIGPEKNGTVWVRRLEDDKILSLPADKAAVLFPNELSLRSLQILDEPAKRIHRLRIRESGREQAFERSDEGSFKVLMPTGKGLSADLGLVSDAADALGKLRAERWVSAKDSGDFGLSSPRMVIEAELSDPQQDPKDTKLKTIKVLVGAVAADGSFAKLADDDSIFILPKNVEAIFSRWLLDRSPLVIEAESLITATIESPSGKRCTLERGNNGILRASGDCANSPDLPAKVRDALSDLLAEGVISLGASPKTQGFEQPALTLSISTQSAGEPKHFQMKIGAKDIWRGTDICYVRREGLDLSFAVQYRKLKPLFGAVAEPSTETQ